MSIHKYSVTPDSNTIVGDGSDAIGLQEGMPRQNVNNAMRAIASDIAKNYKDHGSLVTAGTGSAYTVTANSDFQSYHVGLSLVVKLHATCAANATINVNGRGAKNLRIRGASGVKNVEADALRSGEVVHIVYNGTQFHVLGAFDDATIRSRIAALEALSNSNPSIVMGTGTDDNFDGIKYDDSGNTFTFWADQAPATDTPIFKIDKEDGLFYSGHKVWHANNDGANSGLDSDQLDGQHGSYYRNASNMNAGTLPNARLSSAMQTSRLHLTSTSDASETSTANALTLGSLTGDFAKFDMNKVVSKSGGNVTTVFWDQVFQKNNDFQKKYFGTTNGADAQIVDENFDGDTGIGLADCYVHRLAIGDYAFFNLRLLLINFSKQADSDATFRFRFDIGAFMTEQGWDRPKLLDSGYGSAQGEFSATGVDFPRVPFYASVSANSSSTYPDTFYFSNADRTSFASTSTAVTNLNLTAMFFTRIGS